MKYQKLILITSTVCLLAFFSSSAHAQLSEIIVDYCEEVLQASGEAADELAEATSDLEDCYDEYDDCLGGLINKDPVKCISDYTRCLSNGEKDQNQACGRFLREFKDDTRTAERQADRADKEDEFLIFLYSDAGHECLTPALAISLACAGLSSD
jgi:hypothetical protein